ncbi:MAG: hypothetical protein GY711_18100 [bacterium]|nr:hypothetical protein [bacterium]
MRARPHHRYESRSRAGFSVIQLLVSIIVLVLLLVGVTRGVYEESGAAGTMSRKGERRAKAILVRMQHELASAVGTFPAARLADDMAIADVDQIAVDTTMGFPDRGTLLIDRGDAQREYVEYDAIGAGGTAFTVASRGERCSSPAQHQRGAAVLWADQAEVIADLTRPLESQFDGITREDSGPTHFRGDGTGFAFRIASPEAAAPGVKVREDRPLGWAYLAFEPVSVVTEMSRQRDINGDGDRLDSFDCGRIEMRTWNSADPTVEATTVALSPPVVLQPVCGRGGDMDGDGYADPIFLWNPSSQTLHVRMTILAGDVREVTMTTRADKVLHLKSGS